MADLDAASRIEHHVESKSGFLTAAGICQLGGFITRDAARKQDFGTTACALHRRFGAERFSAPGPEGPVGLPHRLDSARPLFLGRREREVAVFAYPDPRPLIIVALVVFIGGSACGEESCDSTACSERCSSGYAAGFCQEAGCACCYDASCLVYAQAAGGNWTCNGTGQVCANPTDGEQCYWSCSAIDARPVWECCDVGSCEDAADGSLWVSCPGDACAACLHRSCSAEVAACNDETPTCSPLLSCLSDCVSGDAACETSCISTWSGALPRLDALLVCTNASCAADCGGTILCNAGFCAAGTNLCCPGGAPGTWNTSLSRCSCGGSTCGDGTCNTGENCYLCPPDCPCPGGQTCTATGTCVTTDPCASYHSCASCTGGATCGWCGTTGACATGSSTGPTTGTCGAWNWNTSDCPTTCTPPPELGGDCNVVTNCGCGTGQRCWVDFAVDPLTEDCTANGTIAFFHPCPDGDNCLARSMCLGSTASDGICAKFCYVDGDCPDGRLCDMRITDVTATDGSGYKACGNLPGGCTASTDCSAADVCVAGSCESAWGRLYRITAVSGVYYCAALDWDGSYPDPYVVVTVDGVAHTSPTAWDTETPTWNYYFDAALLSTSTFAYAVYNYNAVSDDVIVYLPGPIPISVTWLHSGNLTAGTAGSCSTTFTFRPL